MHLLPSEPASSARPPRAAAAIGVFSAALISVLGCAQGSQWTLDYRPGKKEILQALEGVESRYGATQTSPNMFPKIPLRKRLRPCCIFGEDYEIAYGGASGPINLSNNVKGVEMLGPHHYDSGVPQVQASMKAQPRLNEENDGLVYTCRGGFIDTAQVRDYADWTVFFATLFGRRLDRGVQIQIPSAAGRLKVRLKPLSASLIHKHGHRKLSAALAQWVTFKLSIWHEIATFYGWSRLPGFSEISSAFSPEDLYSSLLGTKIGGALVRRRLSRTESTYNKSMNLWLREALTHLGARKRLVGRSAVYDVNGVWWDNTKKVGQLSYLLRRNLETGPRIHPWLLRPRAPWLKRNLRAKCGPTPQKATLDVPAGLDGIRFSDWTHLEVHVSRALAGKSPFHTLGRKLDETDFPRVLKTIRSAIHHRFGRYSTQPYSPPKKKKTPCRKGDKKKGPKRSPPDKTENHKPANKRKNHKGDETPQKSEPRRTNEPN